MKGAEVSRFGRDRVCDRDRASGARGCQNMAVALERIEQDGGLSSPFSRDPRPLAPRPRRSKVSTIDTCSA